jgi:pimeloyl-ACP methyl ester carboxylesterase
MSVEASSDFSAAMPSSSLGLLRQIDAGLLNIGYVDIGPAEGPVVVLLHGWPYDIHSYVDVCPGLTAAGYRVIDPVCA